MTASGLSRSRTPLTYVANSSSLRRPSVSAITFAISGRFPTGTGSSSPTRLTSKTSLSSAAFPPTAVYTVCTATPALAATSAIVVAA